MKNMYTTRKLNNAGMVVVRK